MTEMGDKLSEEEAKFIMAEAQLDLEGIMNFKTYIRDMMRF